MRFQAGFVGLVASCAFWGLTACSAAQKTSEGDALFESGKFAEALQSYQSAAKESSGDSLIQEKVKKAKVFAWMEEGRELVFRGDHFRALDRFKAVLELDPENEMARVWIRKTHEKIVKKKIDQGYDWLAEESYEMATEAFQEALALSDKNEDALLGLHRIRVILDRELTKSKNYYLRAVRDKAANLLYQADANFDKAKLYDPTNPEVIERGKEVRHQLAEQRFLDAKKRESERHFGAALVGYRSVRNMAPDYPELAERIAAVELEIQAEEIFRKGKVFLTRGDFDLATKTLEEAKKLTKVEKLSHEIDEKLQEALQRELATIYLKASSLEQAKQYEEALESFQAILQKTSYYQDSISRREWLEGIVKKANDLYESGKKAEEEGRQDAAIQAYQEIVGFYPLFRDIRSRLDRLQKP